MRRERRCGEAIMATANVITATRLVLRFTGVKVALWKTEFHHPKYAPGGRRTARGRDPGANIAHGTFEWTLVVKVLVSYLLRCAAWALRREKGLESGTCPSLEGERGTPAASLNYALSKKPRWI